MPKNVLFFEKKMLKNRRSL